MINRTYAFFYDNGHPTPRLQGCCVSPDKYELLELSLRLYTDRIPIPPRVSTTHEAPFFRIKSDTVPTANSRCPVR